MSKITRFFILTLLIGLGFISTSYFMGLNNFTISYPIESTETKKSKVERKTATLSDFDKIEVDLKNYDLEITENSSDKNEIVYPVNKKDKKSEISFEEKNGTFFLSEKENSKKPSNKIVIFNFGHQDPESYTIQLKLAAKNRIKDSSITLANGDLHLDNISLENSFLEAGNGDTSIKSGIFTKVNLTSTSGDISIHQTQLIHTEIRNIDGDINGTSILTKDTVDFSSISGDIDIDIKNLDKFNLAFDALNGDITVNNKEKGSNYEKEVPQPQGSILASSVNGDISFHSK